MEAKKSPRSDLENYRSIFVLLGLIVSIGVVFISLSFTKEDVSVDVINNTTAFVDGDMVEITRQPPEVKTPPPPKQVNQDFITLVDNETEVKLFDFPIEKYDDPTVFVDPNDVDDPFEFKVTDDPVIVAEVMPEPMVNINSFISNNVKYPQLAIDNEIQGTVYIRFVVSKTGKVTDVEVYRGVDPILDEEAVRVVKSLPDFKPGLQGGRPVNVWYNVPIIFKLK
ncbi:MAG: energy transducer TonB [Bacteroidales bacterium]|nr:energy transducer TonB [Bacteroidales bacterium]